MTLLIALIIAALLLVVLTLFSTIMQFLLTRHVRMTGWKAVKKPLVITAIGNIFFAILTWVSTATATIVWAAHARNDWTIGLAVIISILALIFIALISTDASYTFDKLEEKEKPMNLSDVVEEAVNS